MLQQSIVNADALQALRTQLQGTLITPDHPDYETARKVWNGMIDKHPAMVVRCASVSDVVASVKFARQENLSLSVRGGGHNVAGHGTCDGGMVIDLSPMNHITVYPETRIVSVGGGATLGTIDAATQAYGLATPTGLVTATGIAGLTLGGGFGWLRNKYGLSCDNLLAAEVVTADGRVIHASETVNRDLLWGLRGGGGNFGIVTTFEFRLHPIGPDVMMAFALHDGEDTGMKRALQFYRNYVADAPDEVSSIAACGIVPSSEHFPAAIHGRSFVLLAAMYTGNTQVGENILRPLREFATPLVDMSGVMPYVQAQALFDADFPNGMRYYWKSLNLSTLDDAVIERIVEHARRQPSVLSTTDLWHVGGAVARGRAEDSAFYGRQAAFLINPEANWEHPADDQANIRWVQDFVAAMQPFSDGSRYLNFAGLQEEGASMVQDAFGQQYQRLVALKQRYDPTNFFRLNPNIPPAVR